MKKLKDMFTMQTLSEVNIEYKNVTIKELFWKSINTRSNKFVLIFGF